MSQQYFFIFSIGPVQSFIAQARKAQDLYSGCRMVSDYCRYAALVFCDKGGTVIFPKIESASITNRFVGTVATENEAEARKMGASVEKAVRDRFAEEGIMAMQTGLGGVDLTHVKGLKEQLETHLEIYWIFSPYDETNYAESFRRAELVFGMSKYMRTPKQMAYQHALQEYHMFERDFLGETGRKCIVDGERNVKIYRQRASEKSDFLNNKLFLTKSEVHIIPSADAQISPRLIQPGEGLSAVSFFKRCYIPDEVGKILENRDAWKQKYPEKNGEKRKKLFPSTAYVAAADALSMFSGAPEREKLSELLEKHDEEFLFAENCTRNALQSAGVLEKDIEEVIRVQRALEQTVKRQGASLHPYYALVAVDVDSLGKHMAQQKDRAGQEEVAQKLHEFALAVEEVVSKDDLGRVLYAGGDDFLLMLNLQRLFPILQEIEEKWNSCGLPLTYSTAFVISHYKAPLSRAVRTARAELRAAKERFKAEGKNAVACCFMTKSGATTTVYFKQDKLALLYNLFEALRRKKYSPKFIFQFAQNMADMGFHGETTLEEQEHIRQFALWELQRLMARAKEKKPVADNREEKEKVTITIELLISLLEEQIRDASKYLDMDNFIRFLKMAELVAKHTNL